MSTVRWHLDYLDSLRGIAVLGVVLIHSHTLLGKEVPLSATLGNFVDSGARGVALFFLVSAFTLFLSHDNRKNEHQPIKNFFIRRFFRLAPMLYVAILMDILIVPQYASGPVRMMIAGLFINGFHPTTIHGGPLGAWSVADEAMFYFCLPLLFAKIKNLQTALIWLFVTIPITFTVSHLAARSLPQHSDYFRFYWFVNQFPIFLMGIVAYFLWKRSHQEGNKVSAVLLAVAVVLYISLLPLNFNNFYSTGLVCLLLLLSLSLRPWRILVNPATRFLGRISYSIYLLHFYPCVYLHNIVKGSPIPQYALIVAGTLAISIPLAYVTWRWVEEPGIRLGRRIIVKLEARCSILAQAC
jgi:peptidoglycan/LPS O-acetylase OafA/YrhL